MKKVEQYQEAANGFYPLMLEKEWQVAILNYMDTQAFDAIDKVEVHSETDEVFLLNSGIAILIISELKDGTVCSWKLIKMEASIIYNIPKNCWHNIAMQKGSSVYIIEKRDTHKNDVKYHKLTKEEQHIISQKIGALI